MRCDSILLRVLQIILHNSNLTQTLNNIDCAKPTGDYLDAALTTVLQIHLGKPMPGDILVFLSGQDEIETLANMLAERAAMLRQHALSTTSLTSAASSRQLLVLPLYAALPPAAQRRVFEAPPAGFRKVILATNVAETSITINGVVYVIDTGVAKVRQHDTAAAADALVVVPVSKAEAWQRSGRAGREAPGVCYRLYTEPHFLALADAPRPEILRANLAAVVLQLKALRVGDILSFDFMDAPPAGAVSRALQQLYQLDALDATGALMRLGTLMAALPLLPTHAKLLLHSCPALPPVHNNSNAGGGGGSGKGKDEAGKQRASAHHHFSCSEEMLIITALLSVEGGIFIDNKATRATTAAAARRQFMSRDGDHLTTLSVWKAYSRTPAQLQRRWCGT
jgi:HrpA-like RNA helicase